MTLAAPVEELRCAVGVMVEIEGGRRVAVEVEEQEEHIANEPYTHMRMGAAQLRFRQLTRVLRWGNVVRVGLPVSEQELREALNGALKGRSGPSAEQAGRGEGRGDGQHAGRGRGPRPGAGRGTGWEAGRGPGQGAGREMGRGTGRSWRRDRPPQR